MTASTRFIQLLIAGKQPEYIRTPAHALCQSSQGTNILRLLAL